jgi:hypothetical protein
VIWPKTRPSNLPLQRFPLNKTKRVNPSLAALENIRGSKRAGLVSA